MGAATYALARRQIGREVAWLAVTLLFLVPWLAFFAPLTITDYAAGFLLTLGFNDLIAWADRQGTSTPPGAPRSRYWSFGLGGASDRLLLRASLLLGTSVTFKLAVIPCIPAAVLFAGLLCLRSATGSPYARAVTLVRTTFLAGGGAVLVLSPWLLKNIALLHQAFYGIAIAVSNPTNASGTAVAPATPGAPEHLRLLASQGLHFFWNDIGPLCVLLPAVPLLCRQRTIRAAWLLLLISAVLWLAFVPLFKEPRYYLGPMVLAYALIAAAIAFLLERTRRLRPAFDAALALYLWARALWCVLLGMNLTAEQGAVQVALGTRSQREYLATHIRPFQAEHYANQLPPGPPIVMVGVTRGYYLDRPYLNDWYAMRLNQLESTPHTRNAELAAWCRAGVRYAILDRGDDAYDNGPLRGRAPPRRLRLAAHPRPRTATAVRRQRRGCPAPLPLRDRSLGETTMTPNAATSTAGRQVARLATGVPHRRLGALGAGAGLAVLCGCALGAHQLALTHGTRWTSPLLLGDRLFDLLLTLTLLAYAMALGTRLGRPLRQAGADRLTEHLAALGLGLGGLTLLLFAAGVARLYYAPLLLAGAAALAFWLRHEFRALAAGAMATWRAWRRRGGPTAPTRAYRLLLVILALVPLPLLASCMVPIGAGSPMEWDAPSYHVSAPKRYAQAHQLIPLPDTPLAMAPSGAEILFVPTLLAGSDGVGKYLNLAFAIGMALAVFALARRTFGSRAGWLALFLLGTLIWLVPEIPASLPDLGAAFLVIQGASDLVAWAGRASAAPETRPLSAQDRLLLRAGLLLGLGVSYKLVNIPILPAALLLTGLFPLLEAGPPPRAPLACRAKLHPARTGRAGAAGALAD